MIYREISFGLIFFGFSVLLTCGSANANPKNDCKAALKHLGYKLNTYTFGAAGIFSKEKHIFNGNLTCYINSKKEIHSIEDNDVVIVKDGFYGQSALDRRKALNSQRRTVLEEERIKYETEKRIIDEKYEETERKINEGFDRKIGKVKFDSKPSEIDAGGRTDRKYTTEKAEDREEGQQGSEAIARQGGQVASADYRIVKEKDSSFGNLRARITLEIEALGVETDRDRIEIMMNAAVERHRKDWPDAVSVRLWRSYGSGENALNRIVYAPDGCGWTGKNPCSKPQWTELLRGNIPTNLVDFAAPTENERESKEALICRRDLQCWGEKHSFAAILTCQPIIESYAKYDYEWVDGLFEPKLTRFRWNDRRAGTLSYTGNKVKFQNGFGAWQRMTYWCHFDPETEKADVMVISTNG